MNYQCLKGSTLLILILIVGFRSSAPGQSSSTRSFYVPAPADGSSNHLDFAFTVNPPATAVTSLSVTAGRNSPIAQTSTVNAQVCDGGNCRIFISSVDDLSGNLGGLAGADATCQATANAVALSGTYKAWLSDSIQSPSTRLTQSPRPYVRVDSVIVANNWAELTSGSVLAVLLDEKGGPSVGNAWTNTGTDGTAGGAGGGNKHCSNWTSITPGPLGNNGNPGSFKDRRWTYNSAGACEDSASSLICVQQ